MIHKAVGFDYGGVIGGVGSIGHDFTQKVCDLLGITQEDYSDVYFSMNHLVNIGGVAGWGEFWRKFLERFNKQDKYAELMALNDSVQSTRFDMDQRMIDLVDRLRQQGYKVGLLSNNTLENSQELRKLGLDTHFDAFCISAEMKLMKPDPQAFRAFTDKLGVQSEELVFVDDAQKSLSKAQECGFTPVLFENYEKLLRDLEQLGIKTD